jgi:prolyl oligopeptidase
LQQSTLPAPPATPRRPVTDEYHGVKVVDDYRWIEDWDNPEAKQWSAAENARTREYLDHLPAQPEIKARLAKLMRILQPLLPNDVPRRDGLCDQCRG